MGRWSFTSAYLSRNNRCVAFAAFDSSPTISQYNLSPAAALQCGVADYACRQLFNELITLRHSTVNDPKAVRALDLSRLNRSPAATVKTNFAWQSASWSGALSYAEESIT
jgi:hypothetical protein